jgi:hypothetical protein
MAAPRSRGKVRVQVGPTIDFSGLWANRRDFLPLDRESRCLSVAVVSCELSGRMLEMLAYLTILAAAVAGFAGAPPWVIAIPAIALSSMSFLKFADLYERARHARLFSVVDFVVVQSIFNAVIATSSAYGFGWLLRVL